MTETSHLNVFVMKNAALYWNHKSHFNFKSDLINSPCTSSHRLQRPCRYRDPPEDSLSKLSHQQLLLTAACLIHFVPFEKAVHFPSAPHTPPPAPPRMFIAQKIISLVISVPLWAAINFSSLHDGPACGHRSLTFSKRSINLSVHPATYPLMFSSSTVVFFPPTSLRLQPVGVVKWL